MLAGWVDRQATETPPLLLAQVPPPATGTLQLTNAKDPLLGEACGCASDVHSTENEMYEIVEETNETEIQMVPDIQRVNLMVY